MREWTLPLHLTRPLNLNDRKHWRVKAAEVSEVRTATAWAAKAAKIPPLARFTAELHYAPRDSRRRDPENLIATLKPAVDGCIDAGVAPDDCPPFYVTTIPVIDKPTGGAGRLWLVVRELPEEAA